MKFKLLLIDHTTVYRVFIAGYSAALAMILTPYVLRKLPLLACHASFCVSGISCRNMLQSKADIRSVPNCAWFLNFLSLLTASVIKKNLSLAFSLRLRKQAVLRKIDYRPDPQFALLLRFFSSSLCLFSSRRRASSSSWSWRHLWKFSTTTPTNMFSTKKLTISRKEMK